MSARDGKPDATGRSSGKIGGRLGRMLRPPKGEPFAWLTRELLESDAYQSLAINARRFIDFLLIEHMNHAGRENGKLKATHAQLRTFGLSANSVVPAIAQAEAVGLVECHRGGMRVATTCTLTFYPMLNGTPASNRWKLYRAPVKNQKSALKIERLLLSK